MGAMQQASRNADERLDELVIERNRLRQATITKELAEIVGGAEALK
jgi:F-type H+-transporting ATPase subunit gamma